MLFALLTNKTINRRGGGGGGGGGAGLHKGGKLKCASSNESGSAFRGDHCRAQLMEVVMFIKSRSVGIIALDIEA